MPPHLHRIRDLLLGAITALCCLGIHADGLPRYATRMDKLPRVALWAWERREDLSSIDTRRYMVAYLDRTVWIGPTVATELRRNPLRMPSVARRMPVVRIEVVHGAELDNAARAGTIRQQVVDEFLEVAREPGASALQIDFDATRSQRAFYRQLLFDLRARMPAEMPLSITALASWCSWDSWLSGLPVDEAVPMMFRMEPDRRRAASDKPEFRIREPLCQGSVGVSTTEPWPDWIAGKRIYIFADQGWRQAPMDELERRLP